MFTSSAADIIHRHATSDEQGDCDDALELTVTRRTWAARCDYAAKDISVSSNRNNKSSSREANTTDGGLTATMTNSCTPLHSTLMTTDVQQQNREMSIDLIWGEPGEDEEEEEVAMVADHCVKTMTPSTVLRSVPPAPPRASSGIFSPEIVHRRLSLHDDGRRSGTVPATQLAFPQKETPSPAAAPVSVSVATSTPTPWNRARHSLPLREPATESRELSARAGYTLPSPQTPLWPALEEEGEEMERQGRGSIVRLPLGRRPSSFLPRTESMPLTSSPQPLAMSSMLLASSSAVAESPVNDVQRRLHDSSDSHSAGGPVRQKRERQVEETTQREQAEAWARRMAGFFQFIDARPLLTVTIDE